jgi:exosortase A-associated hydrolase 1
MVERPVVMKCGADSLVGIFTAGFHQPGAARPGIVIVVGGPQYRIGSHRQFVVQSRGWAAAGYDVLRFDYRGMGDSTGSPRSFESIHEDISAAIDGMLRESAFVPGVVLFGLCDAASAILMYAPKDSRVLGLMLANPWVRTQASEARATLWHYYPRRLLQPSFWHKAAEGGLQVPSIWRGLVAAIMGSKRSSSEGFLETMLQGWQRFAGKVAVFVSGDDLTAAEFTDLCKFSSEWGRIARSDSTSVVQIPGADHTFSSRGDLDRFVTSSITWLQGTFG